MHLQRGDGAGLWFPDGDRWSIRKVALPGIAIYAAMGRAAGDEPQVAAGLLIGDSRPGCRS
jgi:hypothetical protein